jgi:hypothetical protein
MNEINNCGIYRITASDGSYYIGSSRNIKRRWSEHRWHLRDNSHWNPKLQEKYNANPEGLVFEIIEVTTETTTAKREQVHLDGNCGKPLCLNVLWYSQPANARTVVRKMPSKATQARLNSYQLTCKQRAEKKGWSRSYLYRLMRYNKTSQPAPVRSKHKELQTVSDL